MPTVLVVDDDADIRETLGETLRDNGLDVYIAADGLAAIMFLRTVKIDCVITDIMMPRLDGMDLLRSIRSELTYYPRVFLMSAGTQLNEREVLLAGGNGFFKKPFSLARILRAVNGPAAFDGSETQPGNP